MYEPSIPLGLIRRTRETSTPIMSSEANNALRLMFIYLFYPVWGPAAVRKTCLVGRQGACGPRGIHSCHDREVGLF
jgi:hypothetical protein